LQNVLRRLCIESGKCVVIADQIAAKGKEAKEDNEVGRVLPMTASGLEYFVDVMIEISIQERDGEVQRVFQVIKSNSPVFEVGFEMIGNVTFKDFLNQMKNEAALDLAFDKPAPINVPTTLEEKPTLSLVKNEMTIDELIAKAEKHGFKKSDVILGAKMYHNQPNIYHLTQEQIFDLDRRITARVEKMKQAQTEQEEKPARVAKRA
jgi:hypothetical protein